MAVDLIPVSAGDPSQVQGDVVFVHGLDGDARTTWHPKAHPELFWPAWLGQDLPALSIWTLSYDAPISVWRTASSPLIDLASSTLSVLEAHDIGGRPLVFIAHSLGGLLVKQLLRHATSYGNPGWQSLHDQVKGIVFLSTPHAGADAANWFRHLGGILHTSVTVKELEAHNAQLRDLNLWFRSHVQQTGLPLQVYVEQRPTHGIQVVDPTSADPGIAGITPILLDTDHLSIAKPQDRSSTLYLRVRHFVETCSSKVVTSDAPIQEGEPLDQRLPMGGFLGSLPSGALVARDRELTQILHLVDAVGTGEGRLVMLAGEPGAGKTRLAQEVTISLHDRAFLIAAGRCYEPEQTVPYYPFLDALATVYAGAPPSLQREAPRRWPYLGTLLPERIGVPTGAGGSGLDEQQRVFRAVTAFLEAVAESRPVAILLDDLQWADSASAKLLAHLAQHTRTLPVLLLGAYRDVEVGRQHPLEGSLRDLHRDGLVERVEVRRLDVAGTAALVAHTMGEEEISSEFAALVHDRTEGNPYFIQQVLRVLIERGDISRKEGAWDRRAVEELSVPESIHSVVGQRLCRLSEAAQDVVHKASVLGQRFQFEDLLALGARDEQELEDALEEAAQLGLVRDLGHNRYSFDHVLTQQAIYGELSSRRKRRLHRTAAEALENLPEEKRERRVAEMAWHFLKGDDPERALPWTLKAGDAAVAVFAYSDAEVQYRTAAELSRELGDREREATALDKQGHMLVVSGRYTDAMRPLEDAARLYQELGNQEGYLTALYRIGIAHGWGGTPHAGIERLVPAVRELEAAGIEEVSPGPAAGLYAALASLYYVTGKWADMVSVAEVAIPLATVAGNNQALAWAEIHRGNALYQVYRCREAQQAYQRAMAASNGIVGDEVHTIATYLYGFSQQELGQLDEAEQCWREVLRVQEQENMPDKGAFTGANLGRLLIRGGRWQEARAEAGRGVEDVHGAGQTWIASYPFQTLGWLCLLQGEREAGSAYLQEALAMAKEIDDFQGIVNCQRSIAWLDIREGRPQDALDRLVPQRRRLEAQGLPADTAIEAEVQLSLGYEELTAEILGRLRVLVTTGGARLTLVEVLRVSAMLATRQGRWEDAMRDLEDGLEIAREVGLPYDEGLLLHEYGRMHQAKGESEEARACLTQAVAIFQPLGAKPDAGRTEQVLAELGAVPSEAN